MPDFFSTFLNIYCLDIDNAQSIAQREQPLLTYYTWSKRGGRSVRQRFILAGARGMGGSSFAAAQAISDKIGNADHYEWDVPPGEIVGSIQVQHKDIALSSGDNDAAARAAKFEIDAGTADFAQNTVRLLLGQEYGAIGQAYYDVQATNGAGTFALQFLNSAQNPTGNFLNASKLQVGDQVELATSADGQTGVVAQIGLVQQVDYEVGFLRVGPTTDAVGAAPASPGAGWTDNTVYFVFKRGERAASAAAGLNGKVTSWSAYVPSVLAGAPATLNGVTRSASSALYGVRLPVASPAATGTLPARVKGLIAFMRAAYGSKHSTLVAMNPLDFDLYDSQLDTKTKREATKSATSNYTSLSINTANGSTEIVSEPEMPAGVFRIFDQTQLELESTNGKIYDIVQIPGGGIWNLRDTSNTLEARPVAYLKHLIGAPYVHGVGSTL